MTEDVQFEESSSNSFTEQSTGMTSWLIKQGFVGNKQQATVALIGFTIVLVILTIMVLIVANTDSSSQQYNSAIYVDPDEDIQ